VILGVDHIGIAVWSVDKVRSLYESLFSLEFSGEEVVPDGTVKVIFLKAGKTYLEFFEPIQNRSVENFLQKRGEGLHHICFLTDDIEKELKELKEKGVELIDPVPRKGARGKRIAFLHPRSLHGVLIELAEGKGKG
jgi:methylmalonyl-CoA epimerase